MTQSNPENIGSEKRWLIEVTEEQLHIIAECVEDIHRFLAGQCELNNTLCVIDRESRNRLRERLYSLSELTGEYDWAGTGCKNDSQRKLIAQTYGIYREIYHTLTVEHKYPDINVYTYPTMVCDENSPLPIIKRKL